MEFLANRSGSGGKINLVPDFSRARARARARFFLMPMCARFIYKGVEFY